MNEPTLIDRLNAKAELCRADYLPECAALLAEAAKALGEYEQLHAGALAVKLGEQEIHIRELESERDSLKAQWAAVIMDDFDQYWEQIAKHWDWSHIHRVWNAHSIWSDAIDKRAAKLVELRQSAERERDEIERRYDRASNDLELCRQRIAVLTAVAVRAEEYRCTVLMTPEHNTARDELDKALAAAGIGEK